MKQLQTAVRFTFWTAILLGTLLLIDLFSREVIMHLPW